MQLTPYTPTTTVSDPVLSGLRRSFDNACKRAIYWSGRHAASGGRSFSVGKRRHRDTASHFSAAMTEARDYAEAIRAITGKRPRLPAGLGRVRSTASEPELPLRFTKVDPRAGT